MCENWEMMAQGDRVLRKVGWVGRRRDSVSVWRVGSVCTRTALQGRRDAMVRWCSTCWWVEVKAGTASCVAFVQKRNAEWAEDETVVMAPSQEDDSQTES